jgi:thiamine-monophosphate kinase
VTTSESTLLKHIYARSAALKSALGDALEIGPGDDCASIHVSDGSLLLTVDQLVEGRHYAPETPVDLIARKCVARSVSDIAAMGGTPLASLATGALRTTFERENELFDAMHRWANEFGCPLVGGDIARVDGPTVLTCTALGTAHPTRGVVTRAGATVGDGVYLVGRVGGSFASGRHLTFRPQVEDARWLCDALGVSLHAMLDVSDGVGRDGARIGEASGVCLEIEAARLPLHDNAHDWRSAIGDGEDYVLLFTSDRDPGDVCAATGEPITRIGRVRACGASEPSCVVVTPSGERLDATEFGWDHRGA